MALHTCACVVYGAERVASFAGADIRVAAGRADAIRLIACVVGARVRHCSAEELKRGHTCQNHRSYECLLVAKKEKGVAAGCAYAISLIAR